MLRTACLAAALAVFPASRAQTSTDLWPLVPGNTWTFVTSAGSWSPGGETTLTGGFDWIAVDSVDTTVGRLPGLRRGTEAGPAECVVRTMAEANGGIRIELRDPADDAPCGAITLPVGEGDGPVLFGGQVEPVVVGGEALGSLPVVSGYSSAGGPGAEWSYYHTFAASVGPLDHTEFFVASGAVSSFTGYSLRRVTLDGVTIGQPLTSRADFWPLESGNRWEFRVTDNAGTAAGAVAWTVVADGAGLALRLDRYADDAVVSTVTCPVTVEAPAAATAWQTAFALACTLPDPLLFPSRASVAESVMVDVYTEGVDVTIGATTVAADVAVGTRVRSGSGTSALREASAGLARGIGPWWWFMLNPEGTLPGTVRRGSLGYARVGGTEYGQHVVSADGAPEAATLALSVAPNPAVGTARVRFSLDAPSAAVQLDLMDALGRRVASVALGDRPAGEGEATLDVSRLAPGVYTVRLLGAGTEATARLSVVR